MNIPMYLALTVLTWKLCSAKVALLPPAAGYGLVGFFVLLFLYQQLVEEAFLVVETHDGIVPELPFVLQILFDEQTFLGANADAVGGIRAHEDRSLNG